DSPQELRIVTLDLTDLTGYIRGESVDGQLHGFDAGVQVMLWHRRNRESEKHKNQGMPGVAVATETSRCNQKVGAKYTHLEATRQPSFKCIHHMDLRATPLRATA